MFARDTRNRRLAPDPILAMRLAAAAFCDPRTAARRIRGEKVSPLVDARLTMAAKDLGVALPALEEGGTYAR